MEKFIIQQNYRDRMMEIWMTRTYGGKCYNVGYNDQVGYVETEILHNEIPNPEIKPILRLPNDLFNRIADAIIEEQSKKGVKSINENHLEGKVVALENHVNATQRNFDKLIDIFQAINK